MASTGWWKNLVSFIVDGIQDIFLRYRKLDFVGMSDNLLQSSGFPTTENVELVKQMLILHRQLENTKARKRLEKWCKRVISIYLIVVGLFVGFTYSRTYFYFDVPDGVMIAILTTTTVNIIGLVAIVLRGHFDHEKEGK